MESSIQNIEKSSIDNKDDVSSVDSMFIDN